MKSKMTTNSQVSTTEPKNKSKLSKQLEQEQNHRNGDHMEGYQQGEGREENGDKGTGNKKHKWSVQKQTGGGYIIRIVWEIEKPKNLYV